MALLTGWKNSLKGVGYFAGSALLAVRCASLTHSQPTALSHCIQNTARRRSISDSHASRYELALGLMMVLLVIPLPFVILGMSSSLGQARAVKICSLDRVVLGVSLV